jgi:hypothetical protein
MKIGVLSTKKPWAMLVFVLVAVNAFVALTSLAGFETPLDQISTSSIADSVVAPMDTDTTVEVAEGENPYTGGAGMNIAAAPILSLILWVLILYGLAKAHTWAWWLLAFSSILAVATAVVGVLAGTGLEMGLVLLFVNILMIAGLFHRQTIQIFRPNLKIVPDGWSA